MIGRAVVSRTSRSSLARGGVDHIVREESRGIVISTRAGSTRRRAPRRTVRGRVAGLVLAIVLVIAGPPRSAVAETLSGRAADAVGARVGQSTSDVWQTLRYRGRNWVARFSAELEIELPGSGPGRPDAAELDWVAELRTRLDSVLLSDKSTRLRAHFDPVTGVVRRLTQLSIGPSPDFKAYEFQAGGVTRLRSEPAQGQTLQIPARLAQRSAQLSRLRSGRSRLSGRIEPGGPRLVADLGPGGTRGSFRGPGGLLFPGQDALQGRPRAARDPHGACRLPPREGRACAPPRRARARRALRGRQPADRGQARREDGRGGDHARRGEQVALALRHARGTSRDRRRARARGPARAGAAGGRITLDASGTVSVTA